MMSEQLYLEFGEAISQLTETCLERRFGETCRVVVPCPGNSPQPRFRGRNRPTNFQGDTTMKDKIKIISNGVSLDTRNIADILMWAAERAEFNARGILEHLCAYTEPERSHWALEADRNLAVIEVLRKDKAARGLLPDYVAKALDDAARELSGAIEHYFETYPEDDATRMLTSGARITLHGYLETALGRWEGEL